MKILLVLAMALTMTAPAFAQGGDMRYMAAAGTSSMTMGSGVGVVKAIDPRAGTVTIQHGPIAALGWPAMTMAFKARSAALLEGLAVGQSVNFQIMRTGAVVQLTAVARR